MINSKPFITTYSAEVMIHEQSFSQLTYNYLRCLPASAYTNKSFGECYTTKHSKSSYFCRASNKKFLHLKV